MLTNSPTVKNLMKSKSFAAEEFDLKNLLPAPVKLKYSKEKTGSFENNARAYFLDERDALTNKKHTDFMSLVNEAAGRNLKRIPERVKKF